MKQVVKKLHVNELREMVKNAINEALNEENPLAAPPPVPVDMMKVKGVLAKREKGQSLSPDEKKLYLSWLEREMNQAKTQAKQDAEKGSAAKAMNTMEKDPQRFMPKESKKVQPKK